MSALKNTILSLATFGLSLLGSAPAHADAGETLHIHNKTGHEVVIFLFQDDHPHLSEDGGTQVGHLHDGESGDAHVPNCKFDILLVDHEDIWHAEFHDCKSTDFTFTKDTGHGKKAAGKKH